VRGQDTATVHRVHAPARDADEIDQITDVDVLEPQRGEPTVGDHEQHAEDRGGGAQPLTRVEALAEVVPGAQRHYHRVAAWRISAFDAVE
jgi:hypothetical protein